MKTYIPCYILNLRLCNIISIMMVTYVKELSKITLTLCIIPTCFMEKLVHDNTTPELVLPC